MHCVPAVAVIVHLGIVDIADHWRAIGLLLGELGAVATDQRATVRLLILAETLCRNLARCQQHLLLDRIEVDPLQCVLLRWRRRRLR